MLSRELIEGIINSEDDFLVDVDPRTIYLLAKGYRNTLNAIEFIDSTLTQLRVGMRHDIKDLLETVRDLLRENL